MNDTTQTIRNLDLSPSRRILIIDDNPSIHDDFRSILCAKNATSAAASKLEAALFDAPAAPDQAAFELDSAMQGHEGLAMTIPRKRWRKTVLIRWPLWTSECPRDGTESKRSHGFGKCTPSCKSSSARLTPIIPGKKCAPESAKPTACSCSKNPMTI